MKYEVSDDFIMNAVASGAIGGEPEPYVMFMSPAAGFLLKFQYEICSQINWYTWNQIFLIFIALSVISYFSINKGTALSIFVTITFVLVVSLDLYQLMQFTKTATIVLIGGFFLLFKYINDNKIYYLISSLLLIVSGCCIRLSALFMIMPIVFVAYLISIGWHIFTLKRAYIGAAAVFLAAGLVWGIDQFFYRSDPQQQVYEDFHNIRSDIIDFPTPIYEDLADDLQKAGLSKNDYYSFITWNFTDSDVFTSEKINKLYQILSEYRNNHKQSFKSILKEIYNQYFWTYIIFIPSVSVYLILLFGNLKAFGRSLFLGMITVLMVVITYIMGRVVYRVEYSILLAMYAFELLFLSNTQLNKKMNSKPVSSIWWLGLLSVIAIRVYYWIPDYQNESKFSDMNMSWVNNPKKYKYSFSPNDFEEFNNLLLTNEGIYYMEFNTGIQNYYLQFNPLFPVPETAYNNLLYLGGVDYLNPARENLLDQHGLSGEIADLNRPNVYLVDSVYNDLVFGFIREHYSDQYIIEPEGQYSGFDIFKVTWQE